MSKETSDTILALVAIVGAIGSAFAFVWNIFELKGQRVETKDLAKLTSHLQHQVNQLSIELGESISRLERCRDLTNNFYLSFLRLRAIFLDKDNYSSDEVVRANVTMQGSIVELTALGDVIGDNEFIMQINRLEEVGSKFEMLDSNPPEIESVYHELSDVVNKLHKRIYELIAFTSKGSSK